MRIVVSLKVVPDYEQVRMAAGATSLDTSSVPRVVYTFDELALEAALKIKDADASTEVVVACLTPDASKVKEIVKKALAMGADKATIVADPALDGADSYAQASVLKAVVDRLGGADVVSYGIPGIQGEGNPAGLELAGLLGWPAVSYASGYTAEGGTLHVDRQIEKGTQSVSVPTPAVVTVGKFPTDPRLPTFKGIMGAKSKPMEEVSLGDLGLGGLSSKVKRVGVSAPAARGAGQKLEGEAADTAKQAVAALAGKKFL